MVYLPHFYFFGVCDRVLMCSPGWSVIHCVAQAFLQLVILLPLNAGITGVCHHTGASLYFWYAYSYILYR
jgi:hypothetical protein